MVSFQIYPKKKQAIAFHKVARSCVYFCWKYRASSLRMKSNETRACKMCIVRQIRAWSGHLFALRPALDAIPMKLPQIIEAFCQHRRPCTPQYNWRLPCRAWRTLCARRNSTARWSECIPFGRASGVSLPGCDTLWLGCILSTYPVLRRFGLSLRCGLGTDAFLGRDMARFLSKELAATLGTHQEEG
ncbi:hypothetical protein BS50DRAFT_263431 [Corynespora cassiicola Philippines]|uniref:Uncharacterized protein n=1 Tax=Corynespora cassiicola Philippines TaxID=1448308 RepID=A0A2T2N1L4_CORCC|nr:hypothetical protein BS50DRAFT_263431 [Corynespora cassiicola Philippines]